ncbi:MAG: hypothetical protein Q4E61_00275, partial [Alphaproteobacteria bacterium]|nr:hypothetical protein [Alphaproteobacteria bacterium]
MSLKKIYIMVLGILAFTNNSFTMEIKKNGLYIDDFGRMLANTTQIVDPLDDYKDLTPRSKFNKACELLSSDTLNQTIGARLLIDAALNDKNTEALEMLRFECKIADDKDSLYISQT